MVPRFWLEFMRLLIFISVGVVSVQRVVNFHEKQTENPLNLVSLQVSRFVILHLSKLKIDDQSVINHAIQIKKLCLVSYGIYQMYS